LKVELLEKNTNLREISSQLEEAFASAEMYQIELDKTRRENSEISDNKKKQEKIFEKMREKDAENDELKNS